MSVVLASEGILYPIEILHFLTALSLSSHFLRYWKGERKEERKGSKHPQKVNSQVHN